MGEVDERNAKALSDRMDDLERKYGERISSLENSIGALNTLVQGQSRVIGEAMQAMMGRGSTVQDPHPEDMR